MPLKNRITLLLLHFFLFSVQAWCQIPIGSWRSHLPYQNAIGMEPSENELWVAASSGVFVLDRETSSIRVLNKVNGLSDIGISAFARHPDQDIFLLGYENGNLDLIQNGTIFNLQDILNSNITGSKRINSIKFSGSFAYLACDFGLVVYNYKKREVRESNLVLGNGGTKIRVRDCAKLQDTLYALTSEGLKAISIRQPLANTLAWKTYSPLQTGLPQDANVYNTIDSLDNRLIISTTAGLHEKKEGVFPRTIIIGGEIRRVRKFGNRFQVCTDDNIVTINDSLESILATVDSEYYKKLSAPSDVWIDGNQTWATDLNNGLLRMNGTDTVQVLPEGPRFNTAFSLATYQNKMVLMGGGYVYPGAINASFLTAGYAVFAENQWKTYRPLTYDSKPIRDFVKAFQNPNDGKLYLSTFGRGIVVGEGESGFSILNDSTTEGGICNAYIPNDCIWNFPQDKNVAKDGVRVADACSDAFGNLWVANVEASNGGIRKWTASTKSWSSFSLPYDNGKFPLGVMADQLNQIWVRMAPGRSNGNAGIWVLNQDGSKKLALNSISNQGALPSNDVYDIAEDKSGYIWIGTSKGLAVFYNPYNAFFSGGLTAATPIFPPEAGRPVLENDVVTAIEIDGANRKWIGTKDNGVWVFNPDISEVVHHFTTTSSPLISNTIYDVKINPATGEVFIATDKGLVSYQGDATENTSPSGKSTGEECDESNLLVFPNPVKKGFSGTIAIRGVANNSEVKIVTASGKLVFKTIAKGGMATWSGKTYEGEKAHPGIYLILASTEDGKANCVTKLAILD